MISSVMGHLYWSGTTMPDGMTWVAVVRNTDHRSESGSVNSKSKLTRCRCCHSIQCRCRAVRCKGRRQHRHAHGREHNVDLVIRDLGLYSVSDEERGQRRLVEVALPIAPLPLRDEETRRRVLPGVQTKARPHCFRRMHTCLCEGFDGCTVLTCELADFLVDLAEDHGYRGVPRRDGPLESAG